jgi:hypothetical protein
MLIAIKYQVFNNLKLTKETNVWHLRETDIIMNMFCDMASIIIGRVRKWIIKKLDKQKERRRFLKDVEKSFMEPSP